MRPQEIQYEESKSIQNQESSAYGIILPTQATLTSRGKKGGWREEIKSSAPGGARPRTRDLRRARRESPAARHRGCLDKQAFLCL